MNKTIEHQITYKKKQRIKKIESPIYDIRKTFAPFLFWYASCYVGTQILFDA